MPERGTVVGLDGLDGLDGLEGKEEDVSAWRREWTGESADKPWASLKVAQG